MKIISEMLQPSVLFAVLWLLILGWAFHAMLRAYLRFHDRMLFAEAQLDLERHARALAERSLGDAHSSLSKLIRQQAKVRDSERHRIARDIHDDLGQNLLALKIDLSLMQVSTSGAHPALHQKVGCMLRNLDLTINSLRAIINNLRPLALESGLEDAIGAQLSEFTRISGIGHEFDLDPQALVAPHAPAVEAMLFRVLQESLSNVARHAQASQVRVGLRRVNGELSLQIEDDGIGLAAATHQGFGLSGMRDRVTAVGGRFAVDSRPGAGTIVSLFIPFTASISAH
jgi:signal transduction histidine kinase